MSDSEGFPQFGIDDLVEGVEQELTLPSDRHDPKYEIPVYPTLPPRKLRLMFHGKSILAVLRQVHPSQGLSQRSARIIHDLLTDLFTSIMATAIELCDKKDVSGVPNPRKIWRRYGGRSGLSSRHIQTATRLILPGELAKHAVSEGTKAVTKFCSAGYGGYGSKKEKTAATRSAKAGLSFSIWRVQNEMRRKMSSRRIGAGAPVYLAAVLEYISAEVLELSGNAARDQKVDLITPRHVMLAVTSDDELNKLFPGTFAFGGSVRYNPHKHVKVSRDSDGSVPRPGMRTPGEAVIKRIDTEQSQTRFVIGHSTFVRLVREIGQEFKADMRFEKDALDALQCAAEDYLVKTMRRGNMIAVSSDRSKLQVGDIVVQYRGL